MQWENGCLLAVISCKDEDDNYFSLSQIHMSSAAVRFGSWIQHGVKKLRQDFGSNQQLIHTESKTAFPSLFCIVFLNCEKMKS